MSWQQLASEFSARWQQSWCSAGVEVLQLRGRKEEAGPGTWPTISLVISPTCPHLHSHSPHPWHRIGGWVCSLLCLLPLPDLPLRWSVWISRSVQFVQPAVKIHFNQFQQVIWKCCIYLDRRKPWRHPSLKREVFLLRGPWCALAIFSPPSCRVIFKYEGCPLLRLSCPAINRYLPESLVLAQRWRDCGNKKVPLSSKPGIPIHIHPADVSMRNITRGTTGSDIECLNQATPMTAFARSFSGRRTF